MRVIQVTPTVSPGDAVSNNIVALLEMLNSKGYDASVFSERIHIPVGKNKIFFLGHFPKVTPRDVVIFHLSLASTFTDFFINLPCKKIIIYHNVTPPRFFCEYDKSMYSLCQNGMREARFLADKVDFCLADSEFNRRDLISMGYKCPIEVLPILMQKSDYGQPPDAEVIKKYSDGWTNIFFAGRVIPNKKQEDVIAAFGWYKKYVNEKSRLFIVGRHGGEGDLYYRQLCKFVAENEIEDVIFTGHVKFSEMIAYYKCASLFLCMSEHEGFCVPIVEAMIFDLPIIAYDAAAVGETLGGGGLLIKDKNPVFVAKCIELLLSDKKMQARFRKAQKKRLDDFSYEKVSGQFIDFIRRAASVADTASAATGNAAL